MLHLHRARRIGLVDLGDDERHQFAESAHDGVEVQLACTVRKPLAEQPMCVRDVGDLGVGAELFEVSLELELFVPRVGERPG
jgi:hypothetical protein